jgi:hypothetical protein
VPIGLVDHVFVDRIGRQPAAFRLRPGRAERRQILTRIAVEKPLVAHQIVDGLRGGGEVRDTASRQPPVGGFGYHSEEKVVGFYSAGDRIKFWGSRGAFWGGFWGLFFGGLFLASPVTGPVVVLGFLATIIVAGIENAAVVGGVATLAAALYSIGLPKDSVIQYESAIKADSFLVMARGAAEEIARAKTILSAVNPSRLDFHRDADATATAPSSVPAAA